MLFSFEKEGYWGLAVTMYHRAKGECAAAPQSYWKVLVEDFESRCDLYQYLLKFPPTIIRSLLRNTITYDIYNDNDIQDFAFEHMRTGVEL